MKVAVILPAAGLGTRMGKGSAEKTGTSRKQFMLLEGSPILLHTVRKFVATEGVGEIVVAVRAEDLDWVGSMLAGEFAGHPVHAVEGGNSRQQSVENALRSLEPDTELVAVHDAVRPFIDLVTIRKVIGEAAETGAAIVGLPAVDTVKQVTTFANLYNSMQAKLPLMTVYLIAIGTASQKYIVLFAGALVGAIFLFRWWVRRPSAKQKVDRVKLRLPLVGDIWLKYQVAQLARILSTLVVGGIPLVQAMETAADSLGTPLLQRAVEAAGKSVREGQPLSGSLQQSKTFPPPAIRSQAHGTCGRSPRPPPPPARGGGRRQERARRPAALRFAQAIQNLPPAGH